jgi:hypothetical protein
MVIIVATNRYGIATRAKNSNKRNVPKHPGRSVAKGSREAGTPPRNRTNSVMFFGNRDRGAEIDSVGGDKKASADGE